MVLAEKTINSLLFIVVGWFISIRIANLWCSDVDVRGFI